MIRNALKKYRMAIFIVFLAGITIFSLTQYMALQKENYYLYANLKQITKQIDKLEIQRQNMLQTIEKQNQEKSVTQDKLAKMEADFAQAKKTIEDLNALSSSLKSENTDLKNRLSQVSQEKSSLEAKLNSIGELKKAISRIKRKLKQVKTEIREKDDAPVTVEGNRGFIVKNGKSTYPAKVVIEVKPLP